MARSVLVCFLLSGTISKYDTISACASLQPRIALHESILKPAELRYFPHRTILLFLYELLAAFLKPLGGKVLVAPLRLKIRERTFREPDIVLVRSASDPRRQNRFWLGADVVVEIVSPDKPERDFVEKRRDYAEVQVPEYWIVNPQDETITVLRLTGAAYVEHSAFGRGANATSVLLDGFQVSVDVVFDAE